MAYGTAHVYGIDLDAVLDEVHASNMTKLGADGRPIRRADGKVLKGPDTGRRISRPCSAARMHSTRADRSEVDICAGRLCAAEGSSR